MQKIGEERLNSAVSINNVAVVGIDKFADALPVGFGNVLNKGFLTPTLEGVRVCSHTGTTEPVFNGFMFANFPMATVEPVARAEMDELLALVQAMPHEELARKVLPKF